MLPLELASRHRLVLDQRYHSTKRLEEIQLDLEVLIRVHFVAELRMAVQFPTVHLRLPRRAPE